MPLPFVLFEKNEAARKVPMRVKSGCDVDVRTRKSVPVASVARLQKKMPHRCVAGRCGNTAKDGFSLHSWPSNPSFARLWTNAVRNTRANFTPTSSSKLCSAHFPESSFEAKCLISQSLGINMKIILLPDAVPTIFKADPPQKKQKTDDRMTDNSSTISQNTTSSQTQTAKRPRGAYRKREAARVSITYLFTKMHVYITTRSNVNSPAANSVYLDNC